METIQALIAACQWDTSQFFIISKNVFDPFIYYSHLLPLGLSIILGGFVFIKNPKLMTSKILFFITVIFSIWVFCDLVTWATEKPPITMFSWSILVIIEPLIYAACLYFVQIFINGKDTELWNKILIGILLLPTFLLAPTGLSLPAYDLTNCDRSAIEGPLAQYGYIIEILFTLWIVVIAMEAFKKTKDRESRQKIVLVTTGILLFLLTFSWGNIVGALSSSTDWRLPQWGLFGMPLFITLLGYLIVKFKTFNIKVLATEALIWSLWIMIGSILLIAKTTPTKIVTGVTEILAIIFGIMLIRSVRREVKQREQLEVLTQELEKKNIKLKELDEQKSQFLSFASHDLKSPMNIIKQFSALIIDKTYAAPEKIMETVVKIRNNAERGIRLVDDFLDIRKIEEGKMEYNFEKKNLVVVVRELVEEFRVLAMEQKKIDVSFTSNQQKIPAMLDVNRFNQVIQNLLSNSLKYTEAGTIQVDIVEEQNSALITVKDTGIGISSEVLPTLFEQFRRAPGVAKKIQGVGLGLYISKQIVLGHGGEIWVSSEGAGHGSTFSVRIKKAA